MYKEIENTPQTEWQMPQTIMGLSEEIHKRISKIEEMSEVLRIKNTLLRGPSPEKGPVKDKNLIREGLIGNLQDAVDRLINLSGFIQEQNSNLESNLG